MRALEAPSGSVPPPRLHAWLSRVARNLTIDSARRRSRWHNIMTELSSQPHVEEIPESTAHEIDVAETLGLLRSLGPLYRRICELRYLERRSYTEIGESLGIPVGTVGTRLHRARQLVTLELERVRAERGAPAATIGAGIERREQRNASSSVVNGELI